MNNGSLAIYVDGQVAGTGSGFSCLETSKPLRIGNLHNGAYNFNGKIDEVKIFNKPLSQFNICELADKKWDGEKCK